MITIVIPESQMGYFVAVERKIIEYLKKDYPDRNHPLIQKMIQDGKEQIFIGTFLK